MTSSTGSPKPRAIEAAGFTLIEVLLVVALLGVIAVVALPNFNQTYQRIQLQETANDLSYLMRYAQSRASMESSEVRLNFAEDNKSYWLTAHQGTREEDLQKAEEFTRIAGRWGRTYEIPEEITVEPEINLVGFFPDGKMDKVTISVCRENECLAVTSNAVRGQIRIIEYAPDTNNAEAKNE